MKKIFALISAAVLLFAAVGCTKKVNNGGNSAQNGGNATQDEVAGEETAEGASGNASGANASNKNDKKETETVKKGYLTTITVLENEKETKPAETMLTLTIAQSKTTAKAEKETSTKKPTSSAAVTAKPKDTTYTTQKYTLAPTTAKPTTTKAPFVAPKVRFKSQIVCQAGKDSVSVAIGSYKAEEAKDGSVMLSFSAKVSGTVEASTSAVIYANCYDSSGGLIKKVNGYVAVKTSGDAAGIVVLPA